jgi:hypothetical protein
MGVNTAFDETARIRELFEDPGNKAIWTNRLNGVEEGMQAYRDNLMEKYDAAVKILNPEFWYKVYNNSYLDRRALQQYLRKNELNPVLQTFCKEHKAGLDYLYMRLAYVRSHPAASFWYVFWDDFWAQNGQMTKVKDHGHIFDPKQPGSIAYKPCSRAKLEPQLDKVGLLSTGRSLFSAGLLDALYQEMDQRIKSASSTLVSPKQVQIVVSQPGVR